MKKSRKYKYREVDHLPATAKTVAEYAAERECNTTYIYELIRKKKADFEIVIFKGINFIIK